MANEMFEICKVREGKRCFDCVFHRQCKNFRSRHNGLKPVEYTRAAEIRADLRQKVNASSGKPLDPEQRKEILSLFEEVRRNGRSDDTV